MNRFLLRQMIAVVSLAAVSMVFLVAPASPARAVACAVSVRVGDGDWMDAPMFPVPVVVPEGEVMTIAGDDWLPNALVVIHWELHGDDRYDRFETATTDDLGHFEWSMIFGSDGDDFRGWDFVVYLESDGEMCNDSFYAYAVRIPQPTPTATPAPTVGPSMLPTASPNPTPLAGGLPDTASRSEGLGVVLPVAYLALLIFVVGICGAAWRSIGNGRAGHRKAPCGSSSSCSRSTTTGIRWSESPPIERVGQAVSQQ